MVMKWYEIMQMDKTHPIQNRSGVEKLPEDILRVAYEEYADSGHGGDQSFERICERGGFGWFEIVTLLYRRVLRLDLRLVEENKW